MEELIKYLKSSRIEGFHEEYQRGYRDCVHDIQRYFAIQRLPNKLPETKKNK